MKLILTSTLVGLLSLHFIESSAYVDKAALTNFEAKLVHARALTLTDASRVREERRIHGIIQRFNPRMDAALVSSIAKEIYRMSIKYANLDVDLICATITHESGRTWDPEARSRAGAMGLMQIMPATGRWLARYEGIRWTSVQEVLYNPIYNIRLGTRYLSQLIENYELEGGLAAYNGGGHRARLWLANDKADGILWAETSAYIPHVLKLYDEFRGSAL